MGIGHQGSTLRQMLDSQEQQFVSTGHLWGQSELSLHGADPAKMMRFQLRVVGACVVSRELAKLTAASPIVRTIGECLFMLLVPEGDVVAASFGLTGHVGAAPLQVRSMIELGYEDNPGIRFGDVFGNNDCRYGSPHAADNYTFIPVFHGGEIIAWSCAMNHIMEVGGSLAPGSYPALSPTCFTDGFIYPPTKIGEDFTPYKSFELMWERRTRQPLFNLIDHRMRVTGAKLLHDKALEIVKEFGIDYFRAATREILERERQRALNFFRNRTVPGIYQEVNLDYTDTYKGRMYQLFPESDKVWLLARRVETQIRTDGSICIDFEGSNSQDYFGRNVSKGGLRVGISWWWIPMVMYGGLLNTAFNYVLDLKAPAGSIFNPDDPYLSSTMCFSTCGHVVGSLSKIQSRAMYSRGILEEAFVKEMGTGMVEQEGIFDNDVPWGFTYFGLAGADSTGARPYKDGDTLCASVLNPQSDSGEDEEFELYMPPLVVIGRSFLPSSCGYGKYRGGMGMQLVLLVDRPGKMLRQSAAGAGGPTTYGGSGASGGYVGIGQFNVTFQGTNMRQLIESGEGYPSGLGEILRWIEEGKLKVERMQVWGNDVAPISLEDGDVWVYVNSCVSGWGDPLDRDLRLIEKDLNEGWVSEEANRIIYGAIAKRVDGKFQVDQEATDRLRQDMRMRRNGRALSAKEWWAKERQRVLCMDFSEPVRDLYKDVCKYEKFRVKFCDVWQLPQDFQI